MINSPCFEQKEDPYRAVERKNKLMENINTKGTCLNCGEKLPSGVVGFCDYLCNQEWRDCQ